MEDLFNTIQLISLLQILLTLYISLKDSLKYNLQKGKRFKKVFNTNSI